MEDTGEANGNVQYLDGKYSAAIDSFTAAIEKNPDSSYLYCNRAAAYFQMELYRKCIADCNTAIQKEKSCLRAYIRKGQAFVALGKPKDAIAAWNAGAAITGPNVDLDLLVILKEAPNTMLNPTSASATPPASASPAPALEPASNPMSILQDLLKKAATSEKPVVNDSIEKHNVDPSVAAASHAVAVKGAVQHGVGLASIDEKIALGYLQVNTGNYKEGIMLFDQLLRTNPRVMAAYIGRGTALALLGQLDKAIADFSSAIEIDRNCVDAWKRRGQSRAALGNDSEALYDLTKAADLDPTDQEVYHQRGLVYFKMRNYRRAMVDFKKAVGLAPTSKLSWNHLGLCLCALGRVHQAIKSHKKATSQDQNFKEAWANMAQAYKELGQTERADYYFTKALRLDPAYVHAYYLRGMAKFAAGDHRGALEDYDAALKADPNYKDAIQMRGMVRHGLGMHRAAIRDYNTLVSGNPSHVAWYNKEVAMFTHHHLDSPINSFNIDRAMAPDFKEGWCKRLNPNTLVDYNAQGAFKKSIIDVSLKDNLADEDGKKLVEASRSLGVKLQLNSPGYSRNVRQHRACGLAVIEIAQQLREVWKQGPKAVVLSGKASSSSNVPHEFGWRDLYDISIRWRQFSEPNDPVWWVDLLTPEQFAEGFGSHTPMITGQTCVVRYYPMWSKAFPIMKNLIKQHPTIKADMKKAVDDAKDNKALHDLMKRDFWVTTPCYSTARPGVILEGTRLTLQYSPPEGYEYSIRTPGTPPRWAEYDYEMAFIFNELATEAGKPDMDLDKVSDLILTLTFYWYNYMPLARGTAAVGYTVLLGLFLSVGIEISAPVIEGQQVDWEGILRPKPADFIEQLKPWMYPARKESKLLDELPDISKTFPTLRHRIEAMNVL